MVSSFKDKPRFVGEKVRVSDAFDLQMGKTPSRKNLDYWRDGDHDWVSIADLGSFDKFVGKTKERINDLGVKDSGIKLAPANTVIMSFKLSLGKTAITVDPVYTNEAIMAFIDKGTYPVDVNFMYHQCKAKDWTSGTNTAVMGKTLNKKTLGQALICLPPLGVQKEIAGQLDFISVQIAQAEKQLSRLDQLVKSRFVEVLDNCDLDTVNRLDGCTKRVKVGFVGTVGKYYTDGSGVPMVRTTNITSMGLDLTDLRFVTEEFDRNNTKSHLRSGDVIIARHGENGRACVYQGPEAQCLNVVIIEPDESKLLPICLEYLMNSDLAREQIASMLVGSTQKVVNTKTIASILVPAIPLDLQYRFAAFVTQVDKPRFAILQQIEKLETLKASLMQEYFG